MRNSTYCLEIGQGVKSLRGSDRGFDCRLTVVRPSADRRFRALKVLTVLLLILIVGVGSVFGDELTVADGTSTNAELPVYGWYADTGFKNQFIYSSSLLSGIAEGSTISGISFYSATSTLIVGTTAKIVVRVAEISNATFSSATYYTPVLTEVYNGNFNTLTTSGSDKLLVLDFSTEYEYNGGNLLVEVQLSPKGSNSPSSSFYGISDTGNGLSGYGSTYANKYIRNFLPKATFTYTAATPVTCAKPTDLTNTALSGNSATFTWTAGGSESEWQYICLPAATAVDWGSASVKTATSATATVDDLSPTTDYKFYVRANCGGLDGVSKEISAAFTTPCATLVAPFEAFDFEDGTNNTNYACWDNSASTCFSNPSGTTQKYYVWGVFAYSGNKMLRMCNYNVRAGSALINTPSIIIPNDGKEYKLVFDYEHSSSQGEPFYVKVSENGGASFTNLQSFAKNSTANYAAPVSFTEAEVSLAGYNNKTIILQFYSTANYGSGAIFVDNVRIVVASSCTKPSALSYSNVTTNSIDLAWTAGGSETAWNVRYKADGDADWTVVPAGENPFTLTGLSDNTHYTAQVQADCGGEQSEWNSTAVSFTTLCNPFALPFAETFDGLTAGVPECWDNSEGTTDNDAYKWNYYATGYSGKCVRFEALYNDNGKDNYLKTPSITISEAAILSFRYKNPKGAALSVYYSIDGGEKAALISSLTTKTAWSDLVEQELPPAWVGHKVVIMFRGVSNCSYGDAYIYLDEVQVKAKPSCAKPTDLGYSAETAEGASLSWAAGGSETAWTIEYSTVADFSSDSHEVAAGTNPFVLTGLNEQTTYYVRVKAECGPESESEYSEAVSFTTKCAAITSFPWTEDFENETNETNVACWDNSASTCFLNPAGTTPSKYVWGVIRTGSYGDYKFQLYMRNFNVRAGTALVNTPSFTLPNDKDMQLVFNYSHLASCDPLVVKVSENGGAFSPIAGASYANDPEGSYNYSSPGTYKEATINLSAYRGKTITLQFFTTANYGDGAIWLDNVKIEQAPSCFKLATLDAATDITPDGATFSWTASASNNEDYYQYICVPTGETPDWATSTKVAKAVENQAVISGLAAGTYDFYVRSWCAEEDQSEAVKGSFTTATIPAPASVSVTGITNNRASAEWTAPSVAYAVQYQYSLVQSGDPVWSAATSDLSHLFDGLTASTNYTLYVRTYFDATHVGAQASTTFTTLCNPETVDAEHPFIENFNGLTDAGEIPSCWDNSEVVLPPYTTTPTAARKWSYFATGYEGKCVRYNSAEVSSGVVNVLATPQIILNADADLTFWAKNPNGGDYKVQISVNDGTRQDLVTGLTGIADWTKQEAPLTYPANTKIQLFFVGTSNYGNSSSYLYLDDVQINPVSCRKPAADPVVDSKDAVSATISWPAVAGAAKYQFSLVERDAAPVWEDANTVTTTSKELTGLQASTSYDFYVRTYCGEENQSEARKVNFKTTCGVAVLPFEENFNTTARLFIPDCWNNTEGTSADSYKWSVETYSGKNSTNGVRFNSSTNDDGATSILATPEIQLGAEKYILSFWCKNPTGGDFKVQIEGEDIAREDLLTGLTGIADWTLKYIEVPAKFANKKVQLFFCGTSNAGDANAYISVDNIRVARGEIFADGGSSPESRLAGLEGQTIDFIMERPMQFNGYYNTLCLPFDLSAAQLADPECPLYNNTVKVFDYATIDNAAEMELQLAIAGASDIQAGVPYFVKYDGAAGAVRNNFLFKEVRIAASTAGSKEDSGVEYRGIFNPVGAQGQAYIFVGAENQLYWPGENRTMNNFRAYFYVAANATVNNIPVRRGMMARIVEREETATGINEISSQRSVISSQKVLENDQVIIIRNGVKYNMQGQKIQ